MTLIKHAVNQLLWPAVCIVCKRSISEDDNGLCRDCWQEMLACTSGDYCPRCGRNVSGYSIIEGICANCRAEKFHFDAIARSGIYTKAMQQMILAFKNGKTELDHILTFLANSALQNSSFYNNIDIFIPVPLHWLKRLIRGYNQSFITARNLNHPKAKVSTDLVRVRYTKSQPSMASFTQRARNVRDAFAVRRGHKFAGRNICLVDDIKTSGATLNECAKVLKDAGASRVFALVLAVAGQTIS
ncbi:MAG: ComF family protein [Sedimentisphaerales bacterium]|nr:ComF family protein [Sedimentisphaerales bacterium]